MITLEQAKQLKIGDVLLCNSIKNAQGECRRYRVNGQIKTWKRSPQKIHIPLKFGLCVYDSLDEFDFPNGVCKFMDLET